MFHNASIISNRGEAAGLLPKQKSRHFQQHCPYNLDRSPNVLIFHPPITYSIHRRNNYRYNWEIYLLTSDFYGKIVLSIGRMEFIKEIYSIEMDSLKIEAILKQQ